MELGLYRDSVHIGRGAVGRGLGLSRERMQRWKERGSKHRAPVPFFVVDREQSVTEESEGEVVSPGEARSPMRPAFAFTNLGKIGRLALPLF